MSSRRVLVCDLCGEPIPRGSFSLGIYAELQRTEEERDDAPRIRTGARRYSAPPRADREIDLCLPCALGFDVGTHHALGVQAMLDGLAKAEAADGDP